jgi:hypothetical protein
MDRRKIKNEGSSAGHLVMHVKLGKRNMHVNFLCNFLFQPT